MNPFVAFLIAVPLLVSGILTIAAGVLLIQEGPKWDFLAAFFVLLAISSFLVLLLRRTSRGSLLEFPGSDQIQESVRRDLTTFVLVILYAVLIGMGLVFFSVDSLRYWPGMLCAVLGLLTCYSGAFQLRQKHVPQLDQSQETITKQIKLIEISLSSHALTRNVLLGSLLVMGFFLVLLYKMLGWDRYFSFLDLAGFLFLGVSLWFWFTTNGIARRKKLETIRQQLSGTGKGTS